MVEKMGKTLDKQEGKVVHCIIIYDKNPLLKKELF